MEECVICGHQDDFFDGDTTWYSIKVVEYRGREGYGTTDSVQLLCGDCKDDVWDQTVLPAVEETK